MLSKPMVACALAALWTCSAAMAAHVEDNDKAVRKAPQGRMTIVLAAAGGSLGPIRLHSIDRGVPNDLIDGSASFAVEAGSRPSGEIHAALALFSWPINAADSPGALTMEAFFLNAQRSLLKASAADNGGWNYEQLSLNAG